MKKKIILIMGLAGSGKSTLSKKIAKVLDGEWINADILRKKYNDWDFSKSGIIRQAKRMRSRALESKKKYVVTDFVCPLQKGRMILKPDYIIWMDTIKFSRFKKIKLEKIFEKPKEYDLRVESKNSNYWSKIVIDLIIKYKWNNKNSTALMLGRFQPFHLGHEKLFEKIIERVDQILICVKDVHNLGDNPFTFIQVKQYINQKLNKKFKNRFKVIKLPNITNIFYGRKVGYNIEKINLDRNIIKISATNIRKKLRKQNKLPKLKKYEN